MAIDRTLEGHSGGVWSCAVSPDGVRAISGPGDNSLKVRILETGKCLQTLANLPNQETAAWVPFLLASKENERSLSGLPKVLPRIHSMPEDPEPDYGFRRSDEF